KQVADDGIDAGLRLAFVERHEGRFRIAVEGDNSRPLRNIVHVLRCAADADGQDDLRIDPYTRLPDLPVGRQQVELFGDLARAADSQAAYAEFAQGALEGLDHGLIAVTIADAE